MDSVLASSMIGGICLVVAWDTIRSLRDLWGTWTDPQQGVALIGYPVGGRTVWVSSKRTMSQQAAAAETLLWASRYADKLIAFAQAEIDMRRQKQGTLSSNDRDETQKLAAGVQRLSRRRVGGFRFRELDDYSSNLAETANKGETISVCIKGPDATYDQAPNRATVAYIVNHELAHIMCQTFTFDEGGRTTHTDEFKMYNRFLNGISKTRLGMDMNQAGSTHCSMLVPDLSV
jgi:hypothetical protein